MQSFWGMKSSLPWCVASKPRRDYHDKKSNSVHFELFPLSGYLFEIIYYSLFIRRREDMKPFFKSRKCFSILGYSPGTGSFPNVNNGKVRRSLWRGGLWSHVACGPAKPWGWGPKHFARRERGTGSGPGPAPGSPGHRQGFLSATEGYQIETAYEASG